MLSGKSIRVGWLIGIVVLLLAVSACNVAGQTSDSASEPETEQQVVEEATDEPEAESLPDPTATDPPTDIPPTAEPVVLNTCDLLSDEELQTLLGEVPGRAYDPYWSACSYSLSAGTQISVSAFHGPLVKEKLNEAMLIALQSFGTPEAQALYDDMEPRLDEMSLVEFVEGFSAINAELNREVTDLDGLGDFANQVWVPSGSAQMLVLRGESAITVATLFMDRETGEALLRPMMDSLWANLPEAFVPAP